MLKFCQRGEVLCKPEAVWGTTTALRGGSRARTSCEARPRAIFPATMEEGHSTAGLRLARNSETVVCLRATAFPTKTLPQSCGFECPSVVCKAGQFGFPNDEMRKSAIQADQKPRERRNSGFVQISEAREMDDHLSCDFRLITRRA
jgi:hypothetical protein